MKTLCLENFVVQCISDLILLATHCSWQLLKPDGRWQSDWASNGALLNQPTINYPRWTEYDQALPLVYGTDENRCHVWYDFRYGYSRRTRRQRYFKDNWLRGSFNKVRVEKNFRQKSTHMYLSFTWLPLEENNQRDFKFGTIGKPMVALCDQSRSLLSLCFPRCRPASVIHYQALHIKQTMTYLAILSFKVIGKKS